MPETIPLNTALTLAAVHHAISPHSDVTAYLKLHDLINGRDLDQLREVALRALWEVGTRAHEYAPDDIARTATLTYPTPEGN